MGATGEGISVTEVGEMNHEMERRIQALSLVRHETIGEDVDIEDLIAMAEWVCTGNHSAVLAIMRQRAENYRDFNGSLDEVRYRKASNESS